MESQWGQASGHIAMENRQTHQKTLKINFYSPLDSSRVKKNKKKQLKKIEAFGPKASIFNRSLNWNFNISIKSYFFIF